MRGLAAIVLAAVIAVGAASAATSGPTLRISGDPLVVRGKSFRPAERVRVRLSSAQASRVRVIRTTAAGTFAATFSLPFDPCNDTLTAVATGPTDERATAKLPARECPPA
jgi:hypothetical protein